MNYWERAALITDLATKMRERGSWTGETHIQKSAYFLQRLLGVPLEYDFPLYKHGPFSFDLRDELSEMRSDGLLELKVNAMPYGPSFHPTERSEQLRSKLGIVEQFEPEVEFVADHLASKGVIALERLSTALYVTSKEPEASIEHRAKRIVELKPHIPLPLAISALEELETLQAAAPN